MAKGNGSAEASSKTARQREKMIDAAMRLFALRGYEGTTLQDIAAELSISGPALYYYFPSKNALLFACVEGSMQRLLDATSQAVRTAPDDPVSRLHALCRTQTLFEIGAAPTVGLVNACLYGSSKDRRVLSDAQQELLRELQRKLVDLYVTILKEGQARGDFSFPSTRTTAFALLGLIQYAPVWYRPGRDPSPEIVAEQNAELALHMVRVPRGGAGPKRQARSGPRPRGRKLS